MGAFRNSILVSCIACGALPAPASAAEFIFVNAGGAGAGTQALAGFEAAAAMWASVLTDPIQIRVSIGFSALGPGVQNSTGVTTNTVSYANIRQALTSDATSTLDQSAVANLQAGALTFVTNEPPLSGAIDSQMRFLDSNNSFDNNNMGVATANLKALGLAPVYAANNANQVDGSIALSNLISWDFDPSNGISAGQFDFVGLAAREIGRILGFRSGVDLADVNALPGVPPPGARGLNNIAWGTVFDLYRYGSFEGATQLDWSIGGSPCFSTDGGSACEALLSTGRLNGDGRSAGYWKDDALLGLASPLGIMDPTASGTVAMNLTSLDLKAFDAIGYDIAAIPPVAPVPEPGTWAMMLLGFGFIGGAMRSAKRRQKIIVSYA